MSANPFRTMFMFVLFFASAAYSFAQGTQSALFGSIVDGSRAEIKGAEVTVINESTGQTLNLSTDDRGQFRFISLEPGGYTIKVKAEGFQPVEYAGLTLRVNEERRFDIALQVGSIDAVVEIRAPITSSSSTTLETVVTNERVVSLPLNGRQLQELSLTAPGVSSAGGFRSSAFNQFGLAASTDGNAGAFTVNGAPSRSNGFFLDGADINIPEQGVISFPPLVESIREFQVQTSLFNAEFGRFSGSIINLITKSGTNEWHGSVYEFFRNDKLDANDFFNNANNLQRTVLKQNQFGVTLGGPIRKNRHFVFGNYEGNRVRQGTGPFASNVPSAAQRAGLLSFNSFTDSNGNGIFDAGEPISAASINVADRISPIARSILDGFIPLPNAATIGANYIANDVQNMTEDAFTIRTDSQITDRDIFTARYSFDDQRQIFPFDIFFVAASLPAFPFPNPERRQSLALAYKSVISPKIINEFRFGLNRQRNPIPNGNTIDPASIGLPNGSPQNEFGRGLPIIRVTGFGGLGGQPLTDNLGASTTNRTLFQYADNISIAFGRHTMKFGGEVRRAQVNSSQYRPLRGSLNFNGSRNGQINPAVPGNASAAALADFLLGLPAVATISSANPTRGFRTTAFSGYAQDEWQASGRLTLNLGLRYEIDAPLTEVNGLLSNLIPGIGNFAVGSDELPRLHDIDRNNFAPRAGFAYRLTEDGKTTLRGGAGIFYDNGVFQDRFRTSRTNAPFAISAIDTNPAPFPTDGSPAATFTRLIGSGRATSAGAIALDFRTPYAVQYNLNVQRELAANLLLEVAYVGRRGLNASRPVNINQIVAVNSPQAKLGAPVGSRPFNNATVPLGARFSNDVIEQQSTGQSTYHSLQVRLERRFTGGSSFLASYTFAKSIDDVSGIGTGSDDQPQDSYNLRAQRAASNFDIKHKFILSSAFALPFGKGKRFLNDSGPVVNALVGSWQISGITTLQSGQPFTVTIGSFDPVLQISNRRPNQISDPKNNIPPGLNFNPAAFAAPPAGELGSVGRNTLRGDSYINSDISIIRQISLNALREGAALQLRAEFFNVYNSVNFNFPVSALSSGAFGRFVSNSTSPRVIQFAVKVQF